MPFGIASEFDGNQILHRALYGRHGVVMRFTAARKEPIQLLIEPLAKTEPPAALAG